MRCTHPHADLEREEARTVGGRLGPLQVGLGVSASGASARTTEWTTPAQAAAMPKPKCLVHAVTYSATAWSCASAEGP